MVRMRLDTPSAITVGPRRVVRRRGALLMETMAAAALFAVVLAIAVPVIASVAAIRQEADHRQSAQLAVANALELMAARHRLGEAVAAVAPTIQLADVTAAALPNPEFRIVVEDWEGVPRGVQVSASLSWLAESGRRAAPVQLTAGFIEDAPREAAP